MKTKFHIGLLVGLLAISIASVTGCGLTAGGEPDNEPVVALNEGQGVLTPDDAILDGLYACQGQLKFRMTFLKDDPNCPACSNYNTKALDQVGLGTNHDQLFAVITGNQNNSIEVLPGNCPEAGFSEIGFNGVIFAKKVIPSTGNLTAALILQNPAHGLSNPDGEFVQGTGTGEILIWVDYSGVADADGSYPLGMPGGTFGEDLPCSSTYAVTLAKATETAEGLSIEVDYTVTTYVNSQEGEDEAATMMAMTADLDGATDEGDFGEAISSLAATDEEPPVTTVDQCNWL